MTDAEIEAVREAMEAQRGEIRAYLAEEGVDVSRWTESSPRDPDIGRDEAESD